MRFLSRYSANITHKYLLLGATPPEVSNLMMPVYCLGPSRPLLVPLMHALQRHHQPSTKQSSSLKTKVLNGYFFIGFALKRIINLVGAHTARNCLGGSSIVYRSSAVLATLFRVDLEIPQELFNVGVD